MVANATESLYSVINLDRVQDGRPLPLTHPTPCHGPFNRRRWQSARSFSQPARSQPVTSESRDESHRREICQIAGLADAMPFSMRGWPTAIVSMQCSALWRHPEPAFRAYRTEFSLGLCRLGLMTPEAHLLHA